MNGQNIGLVICHDMKHIGQKADVYKRQPYSGSSPYDTSPYGGSSPYGSSPYGSNPYGSYPYGGQNSSTTPGPAV